MAVLTATARAGEFLASDAGWTRSRDYITIAQNQTLAVGQILGQVDTGAVGAAAANGGNTGNATVSAPTSKPGVQVGTYRVNFTGATTFEVVDPKGDVVGAGKTAAAFNNQVGFTITAGGTPMAVGDGFTIAVAAGSSQYVALDLAATNGADAPAAILWDAVTTGAGVTAQAVGVLRDAEVHGGLIVYPAGASDPQKATIKAALAALGIIVREPV